MYMEGILWKWTNYFSGWQARWFILDNGILSYYKSEEDVVSGCKGSIKVSACDIVVHGTDHSRLDLIVPGEQHFYIRASSAQERQEWLVALGSTKASMGKSVEESGNMSPDILRTKRSELRLYCDLLMQQVHSVKEAVKQKDKPDILKLTEATSLLEPTCDTFIETLDECMKIIQSSLPFEGSHTHVTDAALPPSPLKVPSRKNKLSTQRSSSSDKSRSPSVSSLENMLNQPHSRSRTLSKNSSDPTLSEKPIHENDNPIRHSVNSSQRYIVNGGNAVKQPKSPSSSSSTHDSVNLYHNGTGNSKHHMENSKTSPNDVRQTESESHISKSHKNGSESRHSLESQSDTQIYISRSQIVSGKSGHSLSKANSGSAISQEFFSAASDITESSEDVFLDPLEARIPTFFSVMNPSFMDIKLSSDGGIPVEEFLGACKSLTPIFDKLNATAFAPVKMDFQGNIRKVRTKHSIKPEEFQTLQSIILYEMQAKQYQQPNSATMALLWMKRSLEFISKFMAEVKNGETKLSTAASNAYNTSLKPFHGWVVRGVFAVAVKALPYHSVFVSLLSPDGRKSEDKAFVECLMMDMESFITAVEVIIKILDDFFTANNLDNKEQV